MAPAPDFTGYATRNGLKCTDGRTIMAGAFKGNDGQKVPLVWQHGHSDPENVLGHAVLTNVADGVRASAFFNNTPKAQIAKQLVIHGDVTALSIYANQLVQKGMNVHHGNIGEVSLVLSGAHPGAKIDNITMMHDGNAIELDDEVIITVGDSIEIAHSASVVEDDAETETVSDDAETVEVDDNIIKHTLEGFTDVQSDVVRALIGAALEHSGAEDPEVETEGETALNALAHAAAPAAGGQTVKDVVDSMTETQRNVMYALIGAAVDNQSGSNATHSGLEGAGDNNEGDRVSRNVFDQTDQGSTQAPAAGYTLTHADVKGIMTAAAKVGSLKSAVEDFALAHGIENIDVMFPEVKLLQDQPDFISRRTEWVNVVLGATRHSPFSRVKSILADITVDEARAKGYVKGDMKQEEFFGVTKRTTTPTTVYKKQKLDRDDILDITDFDVIAWMKGEMRLMLDEEVARAILIGDGRDISSADKIKDPAGASDGAGIRSVLNDHQIYVTTVNVNVDDANSTADEIVDAVVAGMRYYRGTGMPTFFTTIPTLTRLILAKDTLGRRLYATQAELAAALMVKDIQTVEPMEELTDVLGIIVNLGDYNVGADNGGDVALFDFFDIDFNQQKYLIETRLSGALVKFKAAIVVKKVASADVLLPDPTSPTFVKTTGVGTIPTTTHVTYVTVADDGTESSSLSSGAQTAIAAGASVHYRAKAASGFFFADNAQEDWTFTRDAS